LNTLQPEVCSLLTNCSPRAWRFISFLRYSEWKIWFISLQKHYIVHLLSFHTSLFYSWYGSFPLQILRGELLRDIIQ
jgi:hypothetical protein